MWAFGDKGQKLLGQMPVCVPPAAMGPAYYGYSFYPGK